MYVNIIINICMDDNTEKQKNTSKSINKSKCRRSVDQ